MDPTLVRHLLDIKEGLGRVEALCAENKDHTLAVSRKADAIRAELDTHEKDPDAHPQAERRAASGVGAIVLGIISALGGIAGLYAMVRH